MKIRLRIRTKLIGGYLTAVLFTLLVAMAGMVGMLAMNGRSGAMFDNVVQPLKLFQRMDNDFLNLQIELRNLVLSPSTRNDPATLKKIDALQQNFYRLSGTVLDAIVEEETRSSFAEFQNALRAYIGDSKTFIDLVGEGREVEALSLLQGDMGESAALATEILTEILDQTTRNGDAFAEANGQSLKKVGAAFSALILVGLLVSLFIGFFLARYVNGAITELSRVLGDMAKGDMTGEFDRRYGALTDELGDLVGSAQALQTDLRERIRGIVGASDGLDRIGGEMIRASDENASALGGILESVKSVEHSGLELTDRVSSAAGTTEQIIQRIGALDGEIQNQAAGVTESAASIEQMASTINSVKRGTENLGTEFAALLASAEDGKTKLSVVEATIHRIEEQSAHLFEANQIVKSIAARTNLLAMNAAIEAAHAGDAGRGFAVVADEIRNLAEQSGSQAGSISRDIREIKAQIDAVVADAVTATSAFASVMDRIGSLGRLESEISQSMQEQSQGAGQITEAIAEINEVTARVRDDSRDITKGSSSIREDMQNLRELGERLKRSLAAIEGETGSIRRTTEGLRDSGKRNAELVAELRALVNRFTVDKA